MFDDASDAVRCALAIHKRFDGHVEFMEYPGKYPMTETFIEALKSLDALKE